MLEVIRMGGLELRFLRSKEDTGGSLDMFEMTVQPNTRMPVPHYHETWDETIYGLAGLTTWRIDGQDVGDRTWSDGLHQARRCPWLPQRCARPSYVPVRPESRCPRSCLLS